MDRRTALSMLSRAKSAILDFSACTEKHVVVVAVPAVSAAQVVGLYIDVRA